jgi:tetratricopeptide (TPR) repeat protein
MKGKKPKEAIMESDYQNDQDIHIDAIRRQFGVTLETAFKYNRENTETIQNIDTLFFLHRNDKEKVLALLYLFSPGGEDELIQNYRGQTGLSGASYDPGNGLIDTYKVMLITALVYNPAFYTMVRNFQDAVNAGFSVKEVDKSALPGQIKDRVHSFPFALVSRGSLKYSRPLIAAAAAFVVILFMAVLVRFFYGGMGSQLNNSWIAGLVEPRKDQDGIAYSFGVDEGARIGILSPLIGAAMGAGSTSAGSDPTIKYYTKAIRRDKSNPSLYVSRGIAYTVKGYLDSAIKDFNRAIKLNPQNAEAYFNRAIAYTGKGAAEIPNALADLETAVSIDSGDRESLYAMGVLYYRQYEDREDRPLELLGKALDAFERASGYKDSDLVYDYLLKLNQ